VCGDDNLDHLIDRALARYTEAEPLAGMEARVLQRVRARHTGRTWVWWAAITAALIPALALVHGWNGPVPAPPGPVDSGASSVAMTPLAAAPRRWSLDSRLPGRARHATHLPRLENFPARTPMTEEERVLVQLVTQSPNEAVKLFSQDERNETEPIKVDPIQVDPLELSNSNATNQLGEKGATD
jgi:hypothetical protein